MHASTFPPKRVNLAVAVVEYREFRASKIAK